MSETPLTDNQADTLSGTTDADIELRYPTIGESTYYSTMYRLLHKLGLLGKVPGNSLRVYKDGDLTFGVRAGHFMDGDTARNCAGAAAQALTDDQTNYIYLTAAATLTVNTTGFPDPSTTPHIPLATILTAAGAYAHTDITDYRGRALLGVLNAMTAAAANDLRNLDTVGANGITAILPAAGYWAHDKDGAETNGGGMIGDVTLTEAAAAYCKVYDHGTTTYANISASSGLAGWTNNYQLTADAANEQVNDAAYFGHTIPFCELAFDMATGGVYDDDTYEWEYWNGAAWASLSLHDNTHASDQDGVGSFTRDGAVHFAPPSDWAAATVDGLSAYWVRCRVTDTQITTTPILNSKEHEIVTPSDAFAAPFDGRITDIRVMDGNTGTLHGLGLKFIVMDFTTGESSGELTWAAEQRNDWWASLTLDVSAGDELAVVVTDENDDDVELPVNVVLAMTVLPQ